MSDQPNDQPTDPQDFLADLEQPRFEMVEKGGKHGDYETRDLPPTEEK